MADKRGICYLFSEKDLLYYLDVEFPIRNATRLILSSPPFSNNPQIIGSTLDEIVYELVSIEDSIVSDLPPKLINGPPPQQISEVSVNKFLWEHGIDLYKSKELDQKEFNIINNNLNKIYVERFLFGIQSLVEQADGKIRNK